MSLILALDQGTSSSRALLLDGSARVLAVHSEPFDCDYPQPGWVEVDAELLWRTQLQSIHGVLAQAEVRVGDIDAIGITNQRETVIAWDRLVGTPLGPAIIWQCRRTQSMCTELRDRGLDESIRIRTGLVVDPYFSASKMRWMLDHWPHARALAARGRLCLGTVDAWLTWRLSGGAAFITDASNAARTMLYALDAGDWDPWLLDLFGIPRACLPRVVDSAGRLAMTAEGVFGARVPIGGLIGDQQAALFGQACFAPGMAKNTYGTGCFLLLNTGHERVHSRHGLLSTVAWQLDGTRSYALEGAVFVAGALLQWLRDGLGLIGHAAESESLARSVADSGGVHVVPAFAGLGAPYWDAQARGLICGLTRGSTRAHIVRAALEAVAMQNVDLLDAMRMDFAGELAELRIDGGMSVNDFLCQLQADLLGLAVCRAQQTESTALGAGLLAGLGVGLWRSLDDLATRWVCERRFEAGLDPFERGRRMQDWRRAVARARSG